MSKKVIRSMIAVILAINIMVMPICASSDIQVYSTSVEPRFNNIGAATLTIGFDSNYVAYCAISLTSYSHCTGFDGMMRLFDSNGTQLKSWAISDYESPYCVEKTWQCEYGKTYTVTFQGYAYGTNSMYDEINLSLSDKCE